MSINSRKQFFEKIFQRSAALHKTVEEWAAIWAKEGKSAREADGTVIAVKGLHDGHNPFEEREPYTTERYEREIELSFDNSAELTDVNIKSRFDIVTTGGKRFERSKPDGTIEVVYTTGESHWFTRKIEELKEFTGLTFTPTGTVTVYNSYYSIKPNLLYSTDLAEWTPLPTDSSAPLTFSQPIYLKGVNNSNAIGRFRFGGTGTVKVSGNIMSIVDGKSKPTATTIPFNGMFYELFSSQTQVNSVEDLILPATTLTESCYQTMFLGCTSLTSAPALPATTVPKEAYKAMFKNCSSLSTPPSMSGTSFGISACEEMFSGCSSLATSPAFNASSVGNKSLYKMFYECTALSTVPTLSAMTLDSYCYAYMFYKCTGISSVPDDYLPAITLAQYCYQYMFQQCSLVKAPNLPAETLVDYCYQNMFTNCSSLNEVHCAATNEYKMWHTNSWLSGVSATGDFYGKHRTTTDWPTNSSGIPSGWTAHLE